MNAARWIEAREGRKSRWTALINWREHKKQQTEPVAPTTAIPLVLVGTFQDCEHFHKAAQAFQAGGFGASEVELVTFSPVPQRTWSTRIHELLRFIRRETKRPTALGACAGMVIVRSAQCFGRACQIIEQCGGVIGDLSAPAK